MKKIRVFSTALTMALAMCGMAHAQNAGTTSPDSGTMSSDTNGSTTMPADLVPSSSVSTSGTSSSVSADTNAYSQQRAPTRSEVKAETAALVRSGMIPHGELSTAFQDKGAQIGSTPF